MKPIVKIFLMTIICLLLIMIYNTNNINYSDINKLFDSLILTIMFLSILLNKEDNMKTELDIIGQQNFLKRIKEDENNFDTVENLIKKNYFYKIDLYLNEYKINYTLNVSSQTLNIVSIKIKDIVSNEFIKEFMNFLNENYPKISFTIFN